MPRHPLPPRDPGETDAPDEHVQARVAYLERLVTQGVTAGMSYRALVSQALEELAKRAREEGARRPRRAEVEDAVRRAEEQLRTEMLAGAQRDRAASYRRLLNVARKLYLQCEQATEPRVTSMLAARLVVIEASLARLAGWNEPERMHVVVTGPSDRLRAALEGYDDEEYARLAAEELERERVVDAARRLVGLPARTIVVDGDEE